MAKSRGTTSAGAPRKGKDTSVLSVPGRGPMKKSTLVSGKPASSGSGLR